MTVEPSIEITQPKKIIICIPAFNEEKNIADVIIQAKKYASEVVVYDDGSTDNTYQVATNNGAIVLRSNRNGGYGKALNTLFQFALKKI